MPTTGKKAWPDNKNFAVTKIENSARANLKNFNCETNERRNAQTEISAHNSKRQKQLEGAREAEDRSKGRRVGGRQIKFNTKLNENKLDYLIKCRPRERERKGSSEHLPCSWASRGSSSGQQLNNPKLANIVLGLVNRIALITIYIYIRMYIYVCVLFYC